MVHSAILQLVTITAVAMLCLPQEGKSCDSEDSCTTVQQYINATGDNFITFEPCLKPPNYCSSDSEYEILAVRVLLNTSCQQYQEVKVFWNTQVEILLKILSGSSLANQTLEPCDVVMNISYVCYKHPCYQNSSSIVTNVTLKPISVVLNTNSGYGKVQQGQSLELECIISGPINAKDAVTVVIRHESHEMNRTKSGTMCTTIIPSLSLSNSGRYFCTVTIDDKHFSSNMIAINVDSNNNDLKIGIGVLGVLLLIILTVSIVAIVYMYSRRQQQRQGGNINLGENVDEGQPLIDGDNQVSIELERNASLVSSRESGNSHHSIRSYQSGDSGQSGNSHRSGSSHQSSGSNQSGGSNRSGGLLRSCRSGASRSDYPADLPPQEGTSNEREV